MSSFRAYFTKHICSERVVRGTPDSATAFVVGDFVFYDTATDTWKRCGANPALIGALAEVDASSANLDPDGRVPLRRIISSDVICIASATDFAQSMLTDIVDMAYVSPGKWTILPAATAAPRLTIVDGTPAAGNLDGTLYHVQIIAANLQFDAVAS